MRHSTANQIMGSVIYRNSWKVGSPRCTNASSNLSGKIIGGSYFAINFALSIFSDRECNSLRFSDRTTHDYSLNMPRAKQYFKLNVWKQIMNDAYATPRNIKATARRHGVTPKQIRYHRQQLMELESRNVLLDKREHRMQCKILNTGRPPLHSDVFDQLMQFFESFREERFVVTTEMLSVEYMRLAGVDLDLHVVRQRIYRWMKREHLIRRRVTVLQENSATQS